MHCKKSQQIREYYLKGGPKRGCWTSTPRGVRNLAAAGEASIVCEVWMTIAYDSQTLVHGVPGKMSRPHEYLPR